MSLLPWSKLHKTAHLTWLSRTFVVLVRGRPGCQNRCRAPCRIADCGVLCGSKRVPLPLAYLPSIIWYISGYSFAIALR
eukprot:8367529-Ditylum_brightwellii.AAC.1